MTYLAVVLVLVLLLLDAIVEGDHFAHGRKEHVSDLALLGG